LAPIILKETIMPRTHALVIVSLLVLLGVVAAPALGQEQQERPNIVFILVDDLGFSDLEPYGAVKIETPHLQQLAENGMRFTQMQNTAKCFPSRTSLLTGLYAQQAGMSVNVGVIEHGVTLGEVLKTADYRTIAVGKHHSNRSLHQRGFDHYYGLRDGAANYFNPGEKRESDPGEPAQKSSRNPPGRAFCFDDETVQPFTPDDPDFYMTDNFTDWALELLGQYENEQRPFFLYLSYTAPHDPLQAWPEDIAKYEGKFDEGYGAIREARYQRQLEMGLIDEENFPLSDPTHTKWDNLSEEERADQARRMEVYAAMIDRLDQNIGRVLDYLRQQGELENTLILFASDNGASAETVQIGDGPIGRVDRWSSIGGDWANVGNTPFRYFKNWSYQGGTTTPMIVHWPGVIEPGSRTHYISHFIDIMPTLVDITGADYAAAYEDNKPTLPMQGQSLLPIFRGEQARRQGPLYWQWRNGKAVYQDGWKLVKQGDRPWELIDLRSDRTETENLYDQQSERVERLQALWQEWWEATADYRD